MEKARDYKIDTNKNLSLEDLNFKIKDSVPHFSPSLLTIDKSEINEDTVELIKEMKIPKYTTILIKSGNTELEEKDFPYGTNPEIINIDKHNALQREAYYRDIDNDKI